MSSRKRVKMSRTRIAARFATLAFCSLSYFFFPTWASFLFSCFFLPSPSFSYWLPSLTLLSPLTALILLFIPLSLGSLAHKRRKLQKDKMQSLYSEVSVYELPFAFRARQDQCFLRGLSECAAGKPAMLALPFSSKAWYRCQRQEPIEGISICTL